MCEGHPPLGGRLPEPCLLAPSVWMLNPAVHAAQQEKSRWQRRATAIRSGMPWVITSIGWEILSPELNRQVLAIGVADHLPHRLRRKVGAPSIFHIQPTIDCKTGISVIPIDQHSRPYFFAPNDAETNDPQTIHIAIQIA